MIQEMVTSSVAVFTNPSGQTFERHERDRLGWALMDAARARVINGLLLAIISLLRMSVLEAHRTTQGVSPDVIGTTIAQPSHPIVSIIGGVCGPLIGSFVVWGVLDLLGRAFGGTGRCAWDISRFSSPLSVSHGIVSSIPRIGWVASLGLVCYGMCLTYLAIPSGMNLPSQQALVLSIILLVIGLLFWCFTVGMAVLAILAGVFPHHQHTVLGEIVCPAIGVTNDVIVTSVTCAFSSSSGSRVLDEDLQRLGAVHEHIATSPTDTPLRRDAARPRPDLTAIVDRYRREWGAVPDVSPWTCTAIPTPQPTS